MMSRADTATKMMISIRPRMTPVRVEIEMPRYVRNQTIAAQRIASGSHSKSFWMPNS